MNIFQRRQLEEYGEDGIVYLKASQLMNKYVIYKSVGGVASGKTVRSRLNQFGIYVFKVRAKGKSFDLFLKSVGKKGSDPFELLQEYAIYLQSKKVKPNQVRALVKTAKKFLRFCGAKIDNEDFQDRVTLPRQQVPDLVGTEKSQIIELLNNCKSIRLKTAIMLIGAMGCRPVEACSVKLSDVDFEKREITFPAEYTKTKVERRRPMTHELAKQLQMWLKWKYRPHWNVRMNGKREYVEPMRNDEDLVLSHWHQNEQAKPEGIYDTLETEYGDLAKMLDIKRKNGRRVLTLKSLRAWVKTTISDLGYSDYSEWFIGHAGSTYYRKSEKELAQIFTNVEPYLTFLDISALEAKQRDMQAQIDNQARELARIKELQQSREDEFERVKEEFINMPPDEQARLRRDLIAVLQNMTPEIFKKGSEVEMRRIKKELEEERPRSTQTEDGMK